MRIGIRGEIEAAAAAIRERGQKAGTLVLDVTDLPAMQAAIARGSTLFQEIGCEAALRKLDAVIHDGHWSAAEPSR